MDKNKDIELVLNRLSDQSEEIQRSALEILLELVRGVNTLNTTSANNYDYIENNKYRLEQIYETMQGNNKRMLADILSMIYVFTNGNLSLHYRLKGGILSLETFGHLYVKKLLANITNLKSYDENIVKVIDDSIRFLFSHNLECDAIDFCHEFNLLNLIVNYSDSHNYERIFLYLNEFKKYDENFEDLILEIALKMKDYPTALIFTLRKKLSVEDLINSAEKIEEKMQIAFMLGRMNLPLPQKQEYTELIKKNFSLFSISANFHLKSFFDFLIEDLQIRKPRKPLEFLKGNPFFKMDRDISPKYLSNLCIANALVHLGFGEDSIFLSKTPNEFSADLSTLEDSSKSEMLSLFSSYGAINYFSQQNTIDQLNELIFSDFSIRRTSALLGLAIANTKVFDDNHTCLAFFRESLTVQCQYQQVALLLGLQMIYSASQYSKVKSIFLEMCYSPFPDVACFSAFCLGSVFCGSGDLEVSSVLIQVLSESKNQSSPFLNLVYLGMGLLFFKNTDYSGIFETLENFDEVFPYCYIMIKSFAHFGSGNVEIINEIFGDYFEEDDNEHKNNTLRMFSILSVALLSSGDELFSKMAMRVLSSISLLEEEFMKSTTAIAMAFLSPSNPQLELVDLLIKFSNSSDSKVILNSIISLGVVGAGTNNTRISEILERLYSYNMKGSKLTNGLILAQGLLHLGKGTMSLSPYILHKNHLIPKNMIGLFAGLFLFLDPENSPLTNKYPFLSYLFVQSSSLKQVICVNKEMDYLKSILRIGNPLNLVGVVGKPKKIASIQTHHSPIIVQENEMVECVDKGFSRFIEDVVILDE